MKFKLWRISSRKFYITCVTFAFAFLTGVSIQSQGTSTWQVTATDEIQVALGTFYEVNSQGFIAESDVYLLMVNPQAVIEFEFKLTSSPSPWLNQTIVYTVLPGYRIPPGVVYPCGTAQSVIGIYHAIDTSNELLCVDTPFLELGESIAPLQRDPYIVEQIFAANRYLIDIQSGDVLDISSTFPSQINREDASNWVAHDTTWWDPSSHLPVAQVTTEVQELNNVLQQDILMCPILTANCEIVTQAGLYVHGFVDDLIISPDGQQILWTALVFPAGEQIVAGSPAGLVQNLVAFQTTVSTGETVQIFDLQNYNPSGHLVRHGRWSPDGRRLLIGLEDTTVSLGLYALSVTFEPVFQSATLDGTVWHDLNDDGLQSPAELSIAAEGITVTLYDEFDNPIVSVMTASDGNYRFQVSAGVPYMIGVDAAGYEFSPANAGSDDNLDSDIDPTTERAGNIVIASNAVENTWDVGLITGEASQ